MKKLSILVFVFSLVIGTGWSQNAMIKQNKVDALNSSLHFANECAHGMLIVHRMLENYNQDINKFVDLDSYKVNFYTNKDLPKDIFDDQENWFYDTSPYEWYDISTSKIRKEKISGGSEILSTMASMKSIITSINNLRFELDDAIIDKDLTDVNQLNVVYEKLEKGVSYYEDFYTLYKNLNSQVHKAYKPYQPTVNEVQFPQLYTTMVDVYKTSKDILTAVRTKEDEKLSPFIEKNQVALNFFRNLDLASLGSARVTSRKASKLKKNISNQGKIMNGSAVKFIETAEVPKEYKQYGKFYYYYNAEIINKFNRYGNGIVFELNNMIDYLDMHTLIFTEMPHYYKVIYPKKLEKEEHLAATDDKITVLPKKLKEREIQRSTRKIKVDKLKFEVALYDHMIEDGDVISLNFNGDWVVEKMLLTGEKKYLKLKLNREGKNYFILHADGVGRRPPNTMAVDYYYKGFKKQIILKSDLNVSEMIEIEYVGKE